jgi:Zn-dependent protease
MFSQQLFLLLNEIVVLFFVFISVFSIKGFCQALSAKIAGDNTPSEDGFLSINPLAHLDILGLIIVLGVYFIVGLFFSEILQREILFALLITFGARTTIPITINDQNFKNYTLGGITTALAGSFGLIIFSALMVCILKILLLYPPQQYIFTSITHILKAIIDISVFFSVLNFVPIPPFDGGRLLRYILPYSLQYIVNKLEEYSLIIFLVLFLVPGISDLFFNMLGVASFYIKSIIFKMII